jgi:hypothetical protein
MNNVLAILWPEQVTFWWDDDDEARLVPDQHAKLDFFSETTVRW